MRAPVDWLRSRWPDATGGPTGPAGDADGPGEDYSDGDGEGHHRRRARRRLRLPPLAVDTAAALALLALVGVVAAPGTRPETDADAAWLIWLMTAGVVPIALRRTAPPMAVCWACGVLLLSEGRESGAVTASIAVLVVAYTVASRSPLRLAALASAALAACGAAVGLAGPGAVGPRVGAVVAGMLALLACFFLGRTVFTRRAYTQALEERARTAELNREAAARQAVLDERRRIARELHDMVAHHISVMGVLASAARRSLVRDPQAADEALGTIEDTGRTTLREMRRLVDVLRTDDDHRIQDPPPEPGVAGLERLVEQVREAGLLVELAVEGRPRPLEPGVDLTVFRIVQEALTNTLKHAGAAHARVSLEFAADALRLLVTDDGHGPALGRLAAGHGLVGMRERVALYGGSLRTGARVGGGFQVFAAIPVEVGPGRRVVAPLTDGGSAVDVRISLNGSTHEERT